MKNKILRKILSCLVAATLLIANIASVSAAEGQTDGTIGIKHYLNGTDLLENKGIVFVGEKFETRVYVDQISEFSAWGMDFHFDPTKVNLVPYDTSASVTNGVVSKGNIMKGSSGVRLNETFRNEWVEGEGALTVNPEMPYVSNDEGYIWLYGYKGSEITPSSGFNKEITVLEFMFEAIDEGDPNVRFASTADEPNDIGLDNGVNFSDSTDGVTKILNLGRDTKTVVIKERPDEPKDLEWNGNKATWSDVVSRGYEVTLYNGEKKIKTVTPDAGELECDFSDYFTTPGDYTFVVTAKGGTYHTDSKPSDKKEVTIQLDTPEVPEWSETTSGELVWTPVEPATKYEITIYKKDESGNFVQHCEPVLSDTNSVQIKDKMSEVGEYKATVKAVGENGYTDSAPSGMSEIFYSGTKINGYVKLDHVAMEELHHGGLDVELYDNTTKEMYSKTTSSADGSFAFRAIPAGNYDIVISGAGVVTRIISNMSISGEDFVLSTVDTPVELWQGNLYRGDDRAANAQNPYGITFINPTDIAEMIKKVGFVSGASGYDPVADFNFDGNNQMPDLDIVLKNAGKNSNVYDKWVIPQ